MTYHGLVVTMHAVNRHWIAAAIFRLRKPASDPALGVASLGVHRLRVPLWMLAWTTSLYDGFSVVAKSGQYVVSPVVACF